MPLTDAQVPLYARRVLFELFSHLKSMDVSLTRLLELNQAPREMLSPGSNPFGGSVGLTPGSCQLPPPAGYSPGTILAPNPHRRGLAIANLSNGTILTLGLGIQTPQVGVGLVVNNGGLGWNGLISNALWTGSVSVVGSAATTLFAGVEVLGRNETRRRTGLNQPL